MRLCGLPRERLATAIGPVGRTPDGAVAVRKAQAYCRRLAKTHYENFTVASRLLPHDLRHRFSRLCLLPLGR